MGISRKFAGISRKFADICFNHFKTNISGMCGHGPRISRSRLSIFYFHRTNSPNPWRPDLKENEAVGAAIWQNHLSHFFGFIAIFVFHRVFSNQDGPSRFFPALGFRRYIYIYIYIYMHIYIYSLYNVSVYIYNIYINNYIYIVYRWINWYLRLIPLKNRSRSPQLCLDIAPL